mgnify:CR=1 FL=1
MGFPEEAVNINLITKEDMTIEVELYFTMTEVGNKFYDKFNGKNFGVGNNYKLNIKKGKSDKISEINKNKEIKYIYSYSSWIYTHYAIKKNEEGLILINSMSDNMNISDVMIRYLVVKEFYECTNCCEKELLYNQKGNLSYELINDLGFPMMALYYKMQFNDYSESEYKVYTISFVFEKKNKANFSISIYFDKNNYFYCVGKEINHNSIEIIYSDFSKKNQYLEDCFICYGKIKFNVKEKFGEIKTRKRISFINIDADKLILPNIKSNQDNKLENPLLLSNSLISISKGKIDTIIGLYKNEPFIPNKIDKNEIKKKLKEFVEPIKNFLHYNKKNYTTMNEYIESFKNNYDIYIQAIKESLNYKNNKDLEIYFSNNFDLLDADDCDIFKYFSEFLLLFPDIKGKSKMNIIPVYFFIYQYYYSKKAIKKFEKALTNLKNEEKIKLIFSACRTIASLLANGFGKKNDDLFELIDFNKEGTIYYDAKKRNLLFIELLKENSEIFPILLQLSSGSSTNYVVESEPNFSSRISMLTLEDVKRNLKLSIPNYGIRVKCFCDFKAISFVETKITIFSETDIFGTFLGLKIQSSEDSDFNKRFVLSNIMIHEQFGHILFSENKSSFQFDIPKGLKLSRYEPSSPIETYSPLNEGNFIRIKDPHSREIRGESGYTLIYHLTRGKKKLYNMLENIEGNFSKLFKRVNLMASEDLTEFCKEINDVANEVGFSGKNDDEEDEEEENAGKKNKYYKRYKKKYIIYSGFPIREKY